MANGWGGPRKGAGRPPNSRRNVDKEQTTYVPEPIHRAKIGRPRKMTPDEVLREGLRAIHKRIDEGYAVSWPETIARDLGIDRRTANRWRHDEGYKDACDQLIMTIRDWAIQRAYETNSSVALKMIERNDRYHAAFLGTGDDDVGLLEHETSLDYEAIARDRLAAGRQLLIEDGEVVDEIAEGEFSET